MKYNYLLFDLDNTLFDFDRSQDAALKSTIEAFDIPFKPNHLVLYHEINRQCWKDFEDGLISQDRLKSIRFEYFLQGIHQLRDPLKFNDTYLDQLIAHPFLIAGAKELLDELKKQYQLVAITNGLKKVQRPRLAAAELTDYFQAIVVSEEIGHAKPAPAFFDYTFKQIGNPSIESCLIIGDNLNSDIKGGINYGIDTCWYNYKDKTKQPEINPTFTITKLSELFGILEQLKV